jgi:hypothetical protein
MDETLGKMLVQLLSDVSKFNKDMKSVQEETRKTAEIVKEGGETIEGVTTKIEEFGKALEGAVMATAAAETMKEWFNAFAGREADIMTLNAALEVNNRDITLVSEQFKKFGEEMENSTATSERATMRMLRMAMTFGNTTEQAMKATREAIAFGAATGRSAESVIRMTAILEEGEPHMIARQLGLQHIKDKTEQVAAAHRALEKDMKVAEAVALTTTGAVQHLSNAFEELEADLGQVVATAIRPFIDSLLMVVKWLKDLPDWIKKAVGGFVVLEGGVLAIHGALKLVGYIWPGIVVGFKAIFGGATEAAGAEEAAAAAADAAAVAETAAAAAATKAATALYAAATAAGVAATAEWAKAAAAGAMAGAEGAAGVAALGAGAKVVAGAGKVAAGGAAIAEAEIAMAGAGAAAAEGGAAIAEAEIAMAGAGEAVAGAGVAAAGAAGGLALGAGGLAAIAGASYGAVLGVKAFAKWWTGFNDEMERSNDLIDRVAGRVRHATEEMTKTAGEKTGEEQKTFTEEQIKNAEKEIEPYRRGIEKAAMEVQKLDTWWAKVAGSADLDVAVQNLKEQKAMYDALNDRIQKMHEAQEKGYKAANAEAEKLSIKIQKQIRLVKEFHGDQTAQAIDDLRLKGATADKIEELIQDQEDLKNVKAAEKIEKEFDRMKEAAKMHMAALAGDREEAKLWELQQEAMANAESNLTEEDFEAVRATLERVKAMKEEKKLMDDAIHVTENAKDKWEKYGDEIDKLNVLLEKGYITKATYAKATEDLEKKLHKEGGAMENVSQAASGTADAYSRIQAYQTKMQEGADITIKAAERAAGVGGGGAAAPAAPAGGGGGAAMAVQNKQADLLGDILQAVKDWNETLKQNGNVQIQPAGM